MSITVENILNEITTNPNWGKVLEIANESKFDSVLGEMYDHERGKIIATLLGYPALGCGAHRVTLDVHGYAVKIPIEGVGFADNAQEQDVWSRSPEKVKKYLSPYLGGSKGIAVFEKATLIEYDDFLNLEDKPDTIVAEIEKCGVDAFDLDSDRYDQWGYIQGELRVLDYGEFSIL